MATITSAVGAAGNWTDGSAWVGGVAPTDADDAVLQATTTSMTISSGAVCRSLTATLFTGTLTHTAGVTLTIGDGTAGAGNVALAFGTFTYTLGNVSTSAISFISTSATVQTVNFNGKTTGNVTFNAASNGSWQYTGSHTCGATAIVTLTKGTLDINGQTCSWGRFDFNNTNTKTLTFGSASITITGSNAWNAQSTGTTFSAGSSTITIVNSGTNIFRALTYGTVIFSAPTGTTVISGGPTFGTLTFNSSNKDAVMQLDTSITVTGTFTTNGSTSVNRILVKSQAVGTQYTITAATVSCSNTDFQDITGAGAGSWDFSARTDIGDCGGNSGITFPASVSQTWNGASGGNWSTNAWTTRVPLPQDDVSLGVAFSASQTVTADMPRLGRSIDWTGATGSPTFANSVAVTIYGSYTLISSLTLSGTNTLTLAGRSNYTFTSSGKTIIQSIVPSCPGGIYTLQDSLSVTGNISFSIGGLNTNDKTVICQRFLAAQTTTRNISFGTSTINITNTATAVNFSMDITNLTYSFSSSTIVQNTTANTSTFAGGGATYGTLTYNVAGSTGELDITGSNSFAAINFSDASNARSLKFTSGTTTTIRNGNGFNVRGTSGKLMTIDTITGTGTFTLTSTNIQSTDYMNVIRSTVDASPKWYAGANSTDGTGNTNWLFTAAPPTGGAGSNNRHGQNMANLQNIKSF